MAKRRTPSAIELLTMDYGHNIALQQKALALLECGDTSFETAHAGMGAAHRITNLLAIICETPAIGTKDALIKVTLALRLFQSLTMMPAKSEAEGVKASYDHAMIQNLVHDAISALEETSGSSVGKLGLGGLLRDTPSMSAQRLGNRILRQQRHVEQIADLRGPDRVVH